MAYKGGKRKNQISKMPTSVLEIKQGGLRWTSITKVDNGVMEWLQREFHFLEADIRDTLPPLQRPKILDRGSYIFMILLFPFYDKNSGEVRPSEVDFFVGKDFLVTVHADELLPLKNLFLECTRDPREKSACFNSDPATLLHEILNRLLGDASRMLVHVSNDIDEIEKKIFSEFEKGTILTLLRVKTNIVNFRRSMQSHKLIINRLLELAEHYFPVGKLRNYSQNLIEMTREIWDLLENYKDTVDALHETNVSLIDFRTNKVLKTLTIFSVIIFSLTLFTSTIGMGLLGTPLVDMPNGFWIALGVMAAGALAMFAFFEKKKWL